MNPMTDSSFRPRPPHSVATLAAILAASSLGADASADVASVASSNPETGGAFGNSVALVGDLDVDGCADVLVGAPLETAAGLAKSGRACVFSGATGALIRVHVSSHAEASGYFGWAVVGLDDLDNDGRGDYAIGAPGQGPGDQGDLYVYSGATGALLWTKDGPGVATGWGGSLARVPDATGDGEPELVVGHMGVTGDAPSLRVYEAKNGALWKTIAKPGGGGAFHKFGQSVAGVDDLTGDGKGDVLVGAPSWDLVGAVDAGAAFVFDGATGAFVGALWSPDAQGQGGFGRSIAGIPDLDGDGRGDFCIGAPTEVPDGSSTRSGQVHVYSGATRAFIRTHGSTLPTEQGIFGHGLAGSGDVDGDGRGDLLVGAPLEGGGPTFGRIYRFSGVNGAPIGSPLTLAEAGASYGMAISATGDITQDGRPDFVAGAPDLVAFGMANAGKAIVHRIVPNDGCSTDHDIPVVGEGWHYVSTIGAADGNPAEGACSDGGDAAFHADVFLRYAPSASGVASVSTCGQATFDTRLAIYLALDVRATVCELDALVACNDDAPSCSIGTSSVEFPATAGASYWIRLGGADDHEGAPGSQGITGVTIALDACLADLDGSGQVDGADLALVLSQWGGGGIADLTGDDIVDGADLAVVLAAWGPC